MADTAAGHLRVHHLNCGNICGLSLLGQHLICHCLLIETPRNGLVLVDTGLGTVDLVDPAKRLGLAFTYGFARPERNPALAAIEQVKTLGFDPKDVRHIVLTHMDLDHTGGLSDFPEALVHVHQSEYQAAMKPASFHDRHRYAQRMWEHHPRIQTYSDQGEPWFGFEAVRGLKDLPPEILMIPLQGHSRGHTAVAVESSGEWLLHAGDAYFDHREVKSPTRQCSLRLRGFQAAVEDNRRLRLHNQDRLRSLIASNPAVKVFSAHNPHEFSQIATENEKGSG